MAILKNEIAKKTRGRPKLDLIYKCRTQVWLYAVSMASGRMTPAQLELLFCDMKSAGKHTPSNRPGLWGKYESGKVSPRIHSRNGKQSIVDRVEERFPGTAYWIKIPFWNLLTAKHMSMDDLKQIYMSFEPNVRDLIIMEETDDKYPWCWRTQDDLEEICEELLKIGDIDAISAILCLFREAKLKQSIIEFQFIYEYWIQCLAIINGLPLLSTHSFFFELTMDEMIEGKKDFW